MICERAKKHNAIGLFALDLVKGRAKGGRDEGDILLGGEVEVIEK
jgi:hypothetical protein